MNSFIVAYLLLLVIEPCLTIHFVMPVEWANKKCEIELLQYSTGEKAIEILTQDGIGSLEACIGICVMDDFTSNCHAVAYSALTNTCTLLELGDQHPTVEVQDGFGKYFFRVRACEDEAEVAATQPTNFRGARYESSVIMGLSQRCEALHMENVEVWGVSYTEVHEDVASMELCLMLCKVSESGQCVGVYYSATGLCRLLEEKQANDNRYALAPGETIAFLQYCDEWTEVVEELHPLPTEDSIKYSLFMPQLNQICSLILFMDGVKDGFELLEMVELESEESCLLACLRREDRKCVAISQDYIAETCSLIQRSPGKAFLSTNGAPFAFIEMCKSVAEMNDEELENFSAIIPNRPHGTGLDNNEVEDVESPQEAPKEETFFLRSTGEVCIVQSLTDAEITSHEERETYGNIKSLRSCVAYCRLTRGLNGCTAVMYTRFTRSCTILVENGNAIVDDNANRADFVVTVKSCEQIERPFGIIFHHVDMYLHTLQEVCNLIAYKDAKHLNNWKYTESKAVDVLSLETCVEVCRTLWKAGCRAVVFSARGECSTVTKTNNENDAVTIEDGQVFIQLANCYDGPITDLLQEE